MQTQSRERNDLRNELREDAQALTQAASDQLHDELDSRKEPLVGQAKSVSSALDKAASELVGGQAPVWLKSALEQGAQQIKQLAETIEGKDSRELVSGVRRLARDNPATFLAACAAAGFAISRIFRAETDDSVTRTVPTSQAGGSQFTSAPTVSPPPSGGLGGVL